MDATHPLPRADGRFDACSDVPNYEHKGAQPEVSQLGLERALHGHEYRGVERFHRRLEHAVANKGNLRVKRSTGEAERSGR